MMLVGARKSRKAEHQLLWEHSEEGMPPRDEVGSGEQAGLHAGVVGGGEVGSGLRVAAAVPSRVSA